MNKFFFGQNRNVTKNSILELTYDVNSGDIINIPFQETKMVYPPPPTPGYSITLKNDVSIEWGDGTKSKVSKFDDITKTHKFNSTGIFKIKLYGTCEYIKINDPKLIAVGGSGESFIHGIDFSSCSNLTTIEDNCFSKIPLEILSDTFKNCNKLTNISGSFLSDNLTVTDVSKMFLYCTGLTSIPSDLFSTNLNLITLNSTFLSCNISSIPSGFLSNNIKLENINSTFDTNSNLTTVDTNFLVNNINLKGVVWMFNRCSSITSNVPVLWNATKYPNLTELNSNRECYYGCVDAINYLSIPDTWKLQ